SVSRCNFRMSLRFGSGWLVIYVLICSCTFICSAPQLRARDYTSLILLPITRAGGPTVEVNRARGCFASHCCVVAFQNSQRLEMCGARRSGQRGWSTCTPSQVHIRDVLSLALIENASDRLFPKHEVSCPRRFRSRHLSKFVNKNFGCL